jgi:hypothetical protein
MPGAARDALRGLRDADHGGRDAPPYPCLGSGKKERNLWNFVNLCVLNTASHRSLAAPSKPINSQIKKRSPWIEGKFQH